MTTATASGRIPLRDRLVEPPLADSRDRRRRLVVSGAVVLAGVLGFLRVWDWWTETEDLSRWDTPLLVWLTEHQDPVLTGVLEVVTTITAPAGMMVISAATVLLWLLRSHHWWCPVLLAGAMAAAVACIVGIKAVAARGRPPVADMLMGADASYSFPSGHTLATTTFVSVVVYLLHFRPRATGSPAPGGRDGVRPVRFLPGRAARWWVAAAGLTVIAVVAFSRLYLGYHWLTDVTASLLLALAILGAVVGVDACRPTTRGPAALRPRRS